MSAELRALYREVIIDHSRRPRNFGAIAFWTQRTEGYNPLCGDKVTVYVDMADGGLKQVAFQGAGCAIAMASASMMTEAVQGRSRAEADALLRTFHALVSGAPCTAAGIDELGQLAVFAGVRGFPARVKCATLAWHTLHAALNGEPETVSTE